jgi:hypothetical protein
MQTQSFRPSYFTNIFESNHHSEMKSYFQSEYKKDAEWAYYNWLENSHQTKSKKKISSFVSYIIAFLPKGNLWKNISRPQLT